MKNFCPLLSFIVNLAPFCDIAVYAKDNDTHDQQVLLEEVTVTAFRQPRPLNQLAGNTSVVSEPGLEQIAHTHIGEAFFQVPGGWVSRGNGQEHLTALRSPVFTGAGACGEFLMAEDLIPLRAAGFCNVNQLFDANTEQAGRIEVIRGPGSVLYGSNAMHGVINIISRPPAKRPETDLSLDLGPHNYTRLKTSTSRVSGSHRFRISVNATHDGGYKNDSGFDQQKFTLRHNYRVEGFSVDNGLTITNLNQETAGFVEGHDAYRDSARKKENPNPEAFRDSRSARLYSRWQWSVDDDTQWLITPYLRWADMTFLQHFVPWQPLEENGQFSTGMQTGFYLTRWQDKLDLIAGMDIEYTRGWLKETQRDPFSPAIPAGIHYDYRVDATVLAPYAQLTWRWRDKTTVTAGVRYENTHYDYDNQAATGDVCDNTVFDCRFFRPADRVDRFAAWSPKLGILYQVNEQQNMYLNVLRGYRAPQATELYRLQTGQRLANLDTEQLDSVELGYRGDFKHTRLNLALFAMQKSHFIFQDTNRQNIGDGASDHQGLELELAHTVTPGITAEFSGTYARHRYANDTAISLTPIDGNDMDTAPRHLARVGLSWQYVPNALASLEVVHLGRYFLNPENTQIYGGHTLFNLRISHPLTSRWRLGIRLTNLMNTDYAERADFAFGSERYFVGEPRSVYFSIRGRFSD